jgi:hypothetical protein
MSDIKLHAEEFKIRVVDQADDNAPEESMGFQDLEVSLEDVGGGAFFVIKTDRWAFEKIQDLVDLLQKVQHSFKAFDEDTSSMEQQK